MVEEKSFMKCGIEIHQQLDTHKLFCECPSVLRNDDPKSEVKRKLHAVRGESGEVDAAARHEASLDREFIYQSYDTTCLVELDEEPPHLINEEALKITLQIALFLNCEILPISQIMRKTVVDGSNTSGFQRTVIVARNGWLETAHGKVRIESIGLEEDAARIVEKKEGRAVYCLDRLGIPLIEIGTAPDIKSPEQAKEVALYIGDVLRSCKVKRGIGTIRQDVNISIEGHPRVEIKGFQDVKMFVPVILNEIKRQEEALASSKSNGLENSKIESEVRNAKEDGTSEFLRPMPGAARMYPETDLPLLRISREMIDNAKKTLPKLRSDIRGEIRETGLSEEMVKLFGDGEKFDEFKVLLKIINDPNFVAKVLLLYPNEISAHFKIENIDNILSIDTIENVIRAVAEEKIKDSDVKHVMEEIAKGKSFDDAIKIEKVDLSELEGEIANIVEEKPGLSIGGYMGLIMAKFKGKVSGKEVTDILNKLIKK